MLFRSLLANHFLVQFNTKFNKNIKGLSSDAWKAFLHYQWPGNVRELENTLEHAFIRCHQDVITVDHLPHELQAKHDELPGLQNLSEEQEALALQRALQSARWNKSKAADLLGISRRTIYRKMEKFGVTSREA